jgi:2',3'-cyclic-nucleotide 2'-phosphodiesterase (5'-nucleotidase family)
MRTTFLRPLLSLAMLLVALPTSAAAQSDQVQVTLFHDTHLHGQLEGADKQTFANTVGLIKAQRAKLPPGTTSFFVGNGDDVASSLMSALFRGQHIVDSFNAAGLDVDTFGNHDFDMGPDRLAELIGESHFTWVSANVRDVRTNDVFGAEAGARQWLIKDTGKVKIGFTGVAPQETPTASSPGPNVSVLGATEALSEVVPKMRADGAQVVVLLSHLCAPDTERVVEEVPAIDVAVGDHCAGVLEQPKMVGNTIVSRRGDELRLLGQLDLVISGGRVISHTYTGFKVLPDVGVDEATLGVLNGYKGRMAAELQLPAGETTEPLIAMRPVMRTSEAAAGNLVADALRAWGGADVGLQNGGGVRGERTFGPGILSRADVNEMLPFPNYATLLRVSGAQLLEALENGVSQVETQGGRFPQVSGLSMTYDPTAAAGARVASVDVGGKPLDVEASYTLATIDFLANGGDGYTVLQDAEVLIPPTGGPVQSALLLDYLAANGTVSPTVEGRVVALAEIPPAP